MLERRSRFCTPHLFLGSSEFRERVSNANYWSGTGDRFATKVSPATDMDVVEAYYRKHLAPTDAVPYYPKHFAPPPSDDRPLRDRGPQHLAPKNQVTAPLMPEKAVQERSPAAMEQRLARMRILADRVAVKLRNPEGCPSMSVEEVAHALDRSKKTVYRRLSEGSLDWSDRGRVDTRSVKRLLRRKKSVKVE